MQPTVIESPPACMGPVLHTQISPKQLKLDSSNHASPPGFN